MNRNEILKKRNVSLKNILSDDAEVLRKTKKIFFVESHRNYHRKLENARQACSVECAARINPDMEIYFIFATNSSGVEIEISDLVEVLLSYPNVHFRYLNLIEFSRGTIMEDFFKNDKTNLNKEEHYNIAHLSDVLRVFLLHQYGGLYLDLDVFSLVPMSVINNANFGCLERNNSINNGVLNFDLNEGHKITKIYLESLIKHFDPYSWPGNGPIMLTSIIKEFCPKGDLYRDNTTKCGIFTAYKSKKCYPVIIEDWQMMFKDEYKVKMMKYLKESDPYFVHLWNSQQTFYGIKFQLAFTSNSAYIEIAKTHCPSVYKTLIRYI